MVKISVVIPVYNAKNYIARLFDSIISQTYIDFEVIIVDDCSTDSSVDVINEYIQKDARLKLISLEKNVGAFEARKIGIMNSNGNYVAFLDSDDWIDSKYLELLYNNILQSDLSCCEFISVKKFKTININYSMTAFSYGNKEAIELLNSRRDIYPFLWNKLFKKDILLEVLNESAVNVLIGEDYTIVINYLNKINKVAVVQDKLYYYYQRPGSVSRGGFNVKMYDVLKNYDNLIEKFSEYSEIQNSIMSYAMYEKLAIVASMTKNKKYDFELAKKIKKELKDNYKKYFICNPPFSIKIAFRLYKFNIRMFLLIYKILNRL